MSSDYKNHRVEDPTKISSRQEKQVKKYVQEYFEKAVSKKKEHDKKTSERKAKEEVSDAYTLALDNPTIERERNATGRDENVNGLMTEDDAVKNDNQFAAPVTPLDQLLIAEGLKRKRDPDERLPFETSNTTTCKRLKSESPLSPALSAAVADIQSELMERSIEGSDSLTTSYHNSPINTGDLIGRSDMDQDRPPPPPPPPPPRETLSNFESNCDELMGDHDIDTTNSVRNANDLDTLGAESEGHEDEPIVRAESDFSSHRRGQLTELRV